MVDRVPGENSGVGPVSPQDKKAYELEFKQGLSLFQRALDDYSHSENMFQKAEFKEVMEKAMQVLKETASALQKKDLLEQTGKLEKDFGVFEEQESPATMAQLQQDLSSTQKLL